jgi:hypothetical protein
VRQKQKCFGLEISATVLSEFLNRAGHAGGVFPLRLMGMMDVVMMRFVMDAMVVMTRMVLIAPWVPCATGLCRRKRCGENDHS